MNLGEMGPFKNMDLLKKTRFLYGFATLVAFTVNFGLQFLFKLDWAISLMVGLVALHGLVVLGRKYFL